MTHTPKTIHAYAFFASCGGSATSGSTFSTTAAVPYAHTCANPPRSAASNRSAMMALPPLLCVSATTLLMASFRALYSYRLSFVSLC